MKSLASFLAVIVSSQATTVFAQVQIHEIAAPPESWINAIYDLSSDGTAVTGTTMWNGQMRPFRWKLGEGPADLAGSQPGRLEATSVAGNGHMVTAFGAFFGGLTGYFWKDGDGWAMLPVPANALYSVPYAISVDGLAIAGNAVTANGRTMPYRWTKTFGYEFIPEPPAEPGQPHWNAQVFEMSADGSTLVGYHDGHVFVWNRATGIALIPVGYNVQTYGPYAVSFDGRFVGGTAEDAPAWLFDRNEGTLTRLYWDDGTPMRGFPKGVTADGSQVVGVGYWGPFIWDRQHGARRLTQVLLEEHGLDLANWSLENPIGISADGRAIAGLGHFGPAIRGWLVTLSQPIPYVAQPPCEADLDANRRVDMLDLANVLAEFNRADGDVSCDVTGDGIVDPLDVEFVLARIGARCVKIGRP